jgi:RNA polymerase sigma-70 factor (ECF subfamily)
MVVTSPDVAKLIDRWIAGDAKAGEELYTVYYERARQFALRITQRELEADEVAHEAVVAGLEGIRSGARPDKFTGWILGVAKFVARSRYRGESRDERIQAYALLDEKGSPRTGMIRNEMRQLLNKSIDILPEDLKAIMTARYIDGQKRTEVAAMLGISVSTLDKKVDQAIARLRQELSRHFTTLVISRRTTPVTPEEVDQLRPSFRDVFRLRHISGLPLEQIAVRLRIPEATARKRLEFAYETLRCGPSDDYARLKQAAT